MNEVEVLQEIAKIFESNRLTMESIRHLLALINIALWLIFFCKDCHGDNSAVVNAIKELTNHFRSRK